MPSLYTVGLEHGFVYTRIRHDRVSPGEDQGVPRSQLVGGSKGRPAAREDVAARGSYKQCMAWRARGVMWCYLVLCCVNDFKNTKHVVLCR